MTKTQIARTIKVHHDQDVRKGRYETVPVLRNLSIDLATQSIDIAEAERFVRKCGFTTVEDINQLRAAWALTHPKN